MRHASGFTLIELLVTVMILGILAAIALPSYNSYIVRSKLTEAHQVLSDLRVKQEQRYQDARQYANALCSPTGSAAAQVKYFDFACNPALVAGAQTFKIEATGKAGTDLEGITFAIDENNTRSTTVTGGSKMAGKGYAAGTTGCWVTKAPNQC